AAEEAGVEAGIEMISVGDFGEHGPRRPRHPVELPSKRRRLVQRIMAELVGHAERAPAKPELVEGHDPRRPADGSKGVHVAVPGPTITMWWRRGSAMPCSMANPACGQAGGAP